MEYDEGELSQESRSRKSKLEIKILNQQLEDEIKKIKMSDPDLHELWCVFKINSENVEPNIKFKFKRIARLNFKEDLEAGDIISREELQKPNFREVYLDYAYKELLRAYISKLRQDELKKYKQAIADGTSYYAPKRK
jgi:phosphoenolpyruvate synthase/pyruvate phosphate dikinase